MKVRAHIVIGGLVQGVFFRASTQRAAQKNGLTGWVKNRFDGRVEAVFEGEKTHVEDTIEWCRQGPLGADIEDVDVAWEDFKGEFDSFSIVY